MLIAKSMEFRPAPKREKSGVCAAEQSPTSDTINKLQMSQYTGGHALVFDVNKTSHKTGVSRHQLP